MINENLKNYLINSEDNLLINETLEDIDPSTLIPFMKQLKEESEKEEDDRSPGFENLNPYKKSSIPINIISEQAYFLRDFLMKCHKSDLSEEDMKIVGRLFYLDHHCSCWGGESFSPRITLAGSFLIRNHHRVLGLDECTGIITKDKEELLLSSIRSFYELLHKSDEFSDDCSTFFTINSEEDGIAFYPEEIPSKINNKGQSIVSVPHCISEKLVSIDSSFSCLEKIGRSGNMYLRFFENQIFVYNDCRYNDEFDVLTEDYSIGFFDNEKATFPLPSNLQDLKDDIYYRLREESYIFDDIFDLPDGLVKSTFEDLMRQAVDRMENKINYSGVEGMFSNDHTKNPCYPYLNYLLKNVSIDGEYVIFTIRPTGLENDYINGNFGEAIKNRFDTVIEEMDCQGLSDQISSIQVYLPEDLDIEEKDFLGDFDASKLNDRLTSILQKYDEPDNSFFSDNHEERIEVLHDFFNETSITFVIKGEESMSTRTAFDIAKYLSINEAASSFFLSRLPVYQSFYDTEEDTCSHFMPFIGSEGEGGLDLVHEDYWDDEDDC